MFTIKGSLKYNTFNMCEPRYFIILDFEPTIEELRAKTCLVRKTCFGDNNTVNICYMLTNICMSIKVIR